MFKNWIRYHESDYTLLKMKLDNKLTATAYENIIKAIYSTYKPLMERMKSDKTSKFNADISVEMVKSITYEVVFDGNNKKNTPLFYFGIPTDKSEYMKQRIQAILPNSTITFDVSGEVDNMFIDSEIFEYSYMKDSMLSLKTTDNNFLEGLLNIKNEILKGEQILFQVQMKPIGDYWKSFNDDKWDKIRNGKDVTVHKSLFDKGIDSANGIVNSALGLADEIMEFKPSKNDYSKDVKGNKNKDDIFRDINYDKFKKETGINASNFSSASRTKKSLDGFITTIKVYIKGCDRAKSIYYATAIETYMRELEEDNRLKYKKIKNGNVTRNDTKLIGINIMSTKELASIVNVPNGKLQRTFKIDSVNVKQVSAPKECLDEVGVGLGIIQTFGENKKVHFPTDKNYLAMPKLYICGMGGGKSNMFLNYANDTILIGDALVDINFVDRCQLAYAIKEKHNNHIIVDLSDENKLPSLMLPEIRILDTDTPFIRKRKAGDCATEVEYFINSVTTKGTEAISTRMSQYLYSSAKIVFIYNNMKIKTVFDILDNKKIRDEWIKKAIDSGIYNKDDYEICKLKELDDDKNTKKIDGVIDRYSVLMRNSTFQIMLESDNPQFDFIDIMDNSKSISICMNENDFRNKETKDIIITYLMCRLRLAMLGRKNKDKVVHVLIDEAHHLNKSLDVISDSIAEPRKYGVAMVFATHYLDQLGEQLKKAILNVGGHFILLKGVGESAFNELKSKIGDEYDYEDIKAMDDWNTFNMIWIRGQHYMFVTKMLDMLKDNHGKKYI